MPQLPEDIIDRLTQMERRIQQLSTAVNSRPALNRISGGTVEITDGGSLLVRTPSGTPMLRVGGWSGDEYGMEIHRQTGSLAMSLFNGDASSTSLQPLRIYDSANREIISDDVATGGLARPWLSLLPPQDTSTARWPQTTVVNNWTTVAMSYNVVWQPVLRLLVNTRLSSGASGQVRVLVNGAQWGSVADAPADFDNTGPIAADFGTVFGKQIKVEVQAQVTSTSGTVYANPVLMHTRQT